jgi:hypothetical protein
MIDAYPTGALTGACEHSRVRIAITYAAGGASLRDENHNTGSG